MKLLGTIFGRLLVRRYVTFVLDSPGEIVDVRPRGRITLAPVNEQNVPEAEGFRGQGIAELFARYLEEGQSGVYAFDGGEVVGHTWGILCLTPARAWRRMYANGYFRLLRGEALIHFCSVREDCRGRGIYPAMLALLSRSLFERGARRVYIDCDRANAASIRGLRKAGFRPLESVLFVQYRDRLIFRRAGPFALDPAAAPARGDTANGRA